MSLKNTVAAERRMDLASLFCMIGRHGPAVVVVVIAMVSMLVVFIIYRTVRGKRRKAAAADGDGRTGANSEESHGSVESTAHVGEEGKSDVKDIDEEVIQTDFKIRHRPAAAVAAKKKKRKHPPYQNRKGVIHAPENKHTPSDDTGEKKVELEKGTKTNEEEAKQGLPDETSAVVGDVVEDAVAQGVADGILKDVMEELHDDGDDGSMRERERFNDKSREDGEKVLKAECQDDEDVITDKDVRSLKNHTERSSELYSDEAVVHVVDVPSSPSCYGQSEKENPNINNCNSYSSVNEFSPEEGNITDIEIVEEEECMLMFSPTCEQNPQLSSTDQDQGDSVTNKAMLSSDSFFYESDSQDIEVIEEIVDENHMNAITAGEFVVPSTQFDDREEEIGQKEGKRAECGQEDGVLCDGADVVKETMPTSDNAAVSVQEGCSSNEPLPCLSFPVKADVRDSGVSGVNSDANTEISGIADSSALSVCCEPQTEDKTAASLDEDAQSAILAKQIPSHETKLPENINDGNTMELTEECNDHVHKSDIQSGCEDQESFQMSDSGNKVDVSSHSDTVQSLTASIVVEEIRHPHDRITSPLTGEELAHPDMSSLSQDRLSNLTENKEELSDIILRATPIMSEDISPPMCPISLQSFEQSELKQKDVSFPVGDEESGISSLADTPDLHNAGKEFGITTSNTAIPVIDTDLQCEGQAEAQNNFFADDVVSSVMNEDSASVVFSPFPSHHFQTSYSEHTDWSKFESFAINEDMFGHEIDNVYHRVMDQFTAQISASVTPFSDDMKIQGDMKAVFEVLEMKEKEKAGGSVAKEMTTTEEEDKDFEKSEISIMEATMDYNEWITESNHQVPPWLSLAAPSFGQDHTKPNQLPSEVCQLVSAVTDSKRKETTEISLSAEVKQTSAHSPFDDNTECNKKVVTVQPLPQNVNVTFRVHYLTKSPYQTVAVTGNQPELGNWKEFTPLERTKDGYWVAAVILPVESHVEWKFVLLDKGGVCRWEECGNRLLDTGVGEDLLVHKSWGLL
ncbi:uncharacterized protein stbd1 [Antennarius striatus]|uniref:uncharacterized protein stbd1 n=1 Tax=Antennarius striatus TaxID=241820 RepID=UPI0035ADA0D8